MIIAVGSDHAGFENPPPFYKPHIIALLQDMGHEVIDCGTGGPDSVDYPDFAQRVCEAVQQGDATSGILICGTGMGIGMAANRYPGIRAAVCVTPEMARLARQHNDANILCLGRRILTLDQCLDLLEIWFATAFDGGERHRRRIGKMG